MATSIDPKSLRVVDLKEELGKRNLAKTGKKDELVARLTEALAAETETAPPPAPPVEAAPAPASASAPVPAPRTTEIEEPSIPPSVQETEILTEQTIEAPTADVIKHTEQPPPTIEQQAQMNDVVDSQLLDTSAPEIDNTKPSEDSSMTAAPVSSSTSTSSPKADQKVALKRKREESVESVEDKRTKTDNNQSTTIKGLSSSAAPVEETVDQYAVCIKGFVRPLITKHLQEFIKQYGDVKRFWIDPIKTHCYIIYETLDQAANAFQSINGTVYPPTNTGKEVTAIRLTSAQASQLMDREQQVADNHGRVNWEKLLTKVMANETIDEPSPADNSPSTAKRRLGGLEQITRQLQQRGAVSAIMDQEQQPPPSILDRLSTSNTRLSMPTPATEGQVTIAGAANLMMEGKSLDDLFLKTKANPPLYYLPVDKDIAARRLEAMKQKIV